MPFVRPRWASLARVWDHLLAVAAGDDRPLTTQLSVLRLEDRVTPDARPLVFTGAGVGQPPLVRAYRPDTGELAFERWAFDPAFTGGVRVATADITGDGAADVVAAAGPGGGPHVVVLDGRTGLPVPGPLGSFFAFDPAFAGGVSVAAGDVTGDGTPDVVAAAGAGGGPHVRVFDGRTGNEVASFFAFDPAFAGGVSVAAADLTGDGRAELVAAAGPGGGPHVRVFDPATLAPVGGPLGSFWAYDPVFRGGVSVTAADVTGDGVPEVVTGAGPGGGPHVRAFDFGTGAEAAGYMAYAPYFAGGVSVSGAGGRVVTGAGPGGGPHLKVFGAGGAEEASLFAGGSDARGGVQVALAPAELGPGVGEQFAAGAGAAARSSGAVTAAGMGGLPVYFERNQGQAPRAVDYLARGSGYTLFLSAAEVVLSARSDAEEDLPELFDRPGEAVRRKRSKAEAVRFRLVGGDPQAAPAGEGEMDTLVNYQSGDPRDWVTGVRTFAGVRYRGVYDGIDVRYRASDEGTPETDYLVAAGADPGRIAVRVAGGSGVAVDADGRLVVSTTGGRIVQSAPVAYQVGADGSRRAVVARFALDGDTVRFALGEYDRGRELVIDPVWGYGTYVGGTGNDGVNAVAVDNHGNAYVAGYTNSTDYPGQWTGGPSLSSDVMVGKLSADGTRLLWVTHFGGSADDVANAIGVDAVGAAYLVGVTGSTNFPVSPGVVGTSGGTNGGGFAVKLTADGLVDTTGTSGYSTYLKGTNPSASVVPRSVAVDGNNRVTIGGSTSGSLSVGLTETVFGTAFGLDAFAVRLAADAKSALVNARLGGFQSDEGFGVALDSSNNIYLAGAANGSSSFPFSVGGSGTGLFGFVARIASAGTTLTYAVGLGAASQVHKAYGVAVASDGTVYTAYQSGTSTPGSADTKVSIVSSSGVGATVTVGGSGDDTPAALGVGRDGRVTVAGTTASTNLSTVNAIQAANAGGTDAFVARYPYDLSSPLFVSYLGGSGNDTGRGVAVDSVGAFFVAGVTASSNIFQSSGVTALSGGSDGYVTKGLEVRTALSVQCACMGPQLPGLGVMGGLVGMPVGPDGDAGIVRAGDGAPRVEATDAAAGGYGRPLGLARTWTGRDGLGDDGLLGSGWANGMLPSVRRSGDALVVYQNGYLTDWFDPAGGGAYQPRHDRPHGLTVSPDGTLITYRDQEGARVEFHGYAAAVAAGKRGRFKRSLDAAGTETAAVTAETGDGKAQEVQRTVTAGGVTTVESWLFGFVAGGANRGLVESVTLRRRANGGAWQTVRQVGYAYHDGSLPDGTVGALRTATVRDGAGAVLDTAYYRYATSDTARTDIGANTGVYKGALTLALAGDAYRRARADLGGTDAAVLGATDAALLPYANLALRYDLENRATRITQAGSGCSACAGGQGVIERTYYTVNNGSGYNDWRTRTEEALPDGTTLVVFSNPYSQPMLTVRTDPATGLVWRDYYRYDAAGRLVLHAHPSAVTGHSQAVADLVNYSGGNAQYLSDSAGLIETYTYASTTTATTSAAGDVAGHLSSSAIRQGEFGTVVPQWAGTYIARTAFGFTTYHQAASTAYRNDNGTGAQTTATAYAWVSGTHRVESVTVTLPTVTAAQNGPNAAASTTVAFDASGRPVWTKDPAGFLGYTAYDPVTGAVVKTIADVNTANTGDFTGLPSGWTTPSGGGLHLISTAEVDALGRATKTTDPLGHVSYAVYNDANREVRVYAGWDAGTGTPTGPTWMSRADLDGWYAESVSFSAAPAVASGRPTGAEAVSGVQSLARTLVNAAGQSVYSDAYVTLSGTSYGTTQTLGTAGVNYLRTENGYDKRGRANRVVGPDGVIHRLVYDALGRPVSAWTGTNDTPTSGFWSPSNPAGMIQLTAMVYDGGGAGDSNLTSATTYPGAGRAARTTEMAYDWRNRPTAVKAGVETSESETVNRPLTRYAYDNLNQVVSSAVYDGDTVAVTSTPAASRLRAQLAFSYDEYGRAYRTDSYGVNQSTGVPAGTPLTSQAWFDHRGLPAKSLSPDGAVVKWQFDGVGRATAGYLTDGGGDSVWSDALNVTGDVVWAQSESTYDADSNLLQTTTRTRVHGETGTGVLGTPTTGVKARVSYAGYYYDLGGRPTDAVDVGTNGGTAWTRPGSVPARSDTALVTSVSYGADGRPKDVTDPRGIVARTLYDLLGRATSTTAAHGTAEAFTVSAAYDSAGRLLSVTAPGSRTTRYGYDAWGRADSVTERYGTAFARTSSVALDNVGGALTATDPAGTVTAFTQDVLGRTVSVTAAHGTSLARTASATFDVLGRPLTATDPRSFVTAYAYDDVNRTGTVTDAEGYAWTSAFDKAGRVTTATNPFGKSTTVGYDLPGRVTSVTDPLSHATTFQYTVNATEDRVTDALSHTTKRTYDNFARVAGVADALNNVTTFGYDRNGNVASVTNAKGVATNFAYDNLDRTTTVTEAAGKTEQRATGYAYTSAGDLDTVTDPLGRQTTFAYDAAGRMTGQTLAANKSEAFAVTVGYDLLDRVTSVTRPGSRTTGYTYDALSQLTKVTEAVGTGLERNTTFGYDAGGNRTSVTDPLAHATAYAYDKLSRVTSITDANSGVVQIAYDKAGRTSSLTDPTGNVTSWGYDDDGRRTSETDPRGKTTAYAYDNADRLTSVTDRIGRVREFGYDDADRLTSEVWKTSGGATVQTQTFGYDAVGNQTSATDPDGSSTLTYDNLDRVVQVAGPWGVTQTFGYDAADNRTSASDSLGGAVTSGYDNLNRLVSRTQTVGGTNTVKAEWTYDAKGDRTGETRSAWVSGAWQAAGTTANTYDALARLVGIDHKNAAGTSVGAYTYGFDAGDRLTSETFNGVTRTFGYDNINQLTSDNGAGLSYDKTGNRTMSGYVTGTGNRTTSDGTWTYTYDDAGQMTAKSKSGEAWAYTYDHRGQMTKADKSATPGGTVTDSVSYKIDAWGNRIERGQSGGTTSTQRYVVDGWDTAKPGAAGTETFEAVADLDGSNAVTARRVFGGGFDDAVAVRTAGGTVSWYGADGLGSVRQVFDNSGAVTGSRAYSAFGVTTATTGTGNDRYGYSGTTTDALTGLVGDDARQYDPALGRWTSDDPIGFGGGDPNLARYVANRPTSHSDPSGLWGKEEMRDWWRTGVFKVAGAVAPVANMTTPFGGPAVYFAANAYATTGDVAAEFVDITGNAFADMGEAIGRGIDALKAANPDIPAAEEEAGRVVERGVASTRESIAEGHRDVEKLQADLMAEEAKKPKDPNERSVTICRDSSPDDLVNALTEWNWGLSGVKLRLDLVFAYDVVVGLPMALPAMWAAEASIPDAHPEYKPSRGFANFPIFGHLFNAIYHQKNGRPLHAMADAAQFTLDLASVIEAYVALGKFLVMRLANPLVRLVGEDLAAALTRQGRALIDGGTVLRAEVKGVACAGGNLRLGARHFPHVGAGDKFATFAGRVPRQEGYFDLYIHSDRGGCHLAQIGEDGLKEVADGPTIKKTLEAAGWDGKQPVRLFSCSAGDPALKKQAAAYKLAKELDVKVLAPTEDIILFEDGSYVITNLPTEDVYRGMPSTGAWREFP